MTTEAWAVRVDGELLVHLIYSDRNSAEFKSSLLVTRDDGIHQYEVIRIRIEVIEEEA